MTIAIPFFENRISNRLDCSEKFLLVSIENGIINKREQVRLVENNPSAMLNMLIQLGVNVMICDGITEFYFNKLNNSPIQVIPWVSGEIEEVLNAYLEGKLPGNEFISHGE